MPAALDESIPERARDASGANSPYLDSSCGVQRTLVRRRGCPVPGNAVVVGVAAVSMYAGIKALGYRAPRREPQA